MSIHVQKFAEIIDPEACGIQSSTRDFGHEGVSEYLAKEGCRNIPPKIRQYLPEAVGQEL